MAIVVQFIKDSSPWIYGAAALMALVYLRTVILARRDRRYAMFSLEREAALNRTYGAWTAAMLLLCLIGLVYFISTTVSQAVKPLVEELQTPTPLPLGRIAVTPTLPFPQFTPTSAASPTSPPPTSRPRPTPTPQTTQQPSPPPVYSLPRCPDPHSIITSPGMNAQVSGMVPILGTAYHENFKYYKLEYGAGLEPTIWSYFAGGDKPVLGGQLGFLNSSVLSRGVYSLRVVTVDVSGNYPPPCQTTVILR